MHFEQVFFIGQRSSTPIISNGIKGNKTNFLDHTNTHKRITLLSPFYTSQIFSNPSIIANDVINVSQPKNSSQCEIILYSSSSFHSILFCLSYPNNLFLSESHLALFCLLCQGLSLAFVMLEIYHAKELLHHIVKRPAHPKTNFCVNYIDEIWSRLWLIFFVKFFRPYSFKFRPNKIHFQGKNLLSVREDVSNFP